MRILASNVDTLGDLVLRQPMFGALTAAGHELMLIVRTDLAPLMPLIAPNARVIHFPHDSLDHQNTRTDSLPASLLEAVRTFQPEILLIPSPRWAPWEEHLATLFPDAQVIGWKGCSLHDLVPGKNQESNGTVNSPHALEAAWREKEQQLRAREEQLINREIELKARFAAQVLSAQNELALAESRESELQTKLAHLETAQASLARELGRLRQAHEQLQTTNAELERRVRELFNSGWRRIGLKFRMAKRASWEQASSNAN